MINTRFEAYKVKREIKRSGKAFNFFRRKVNEFGELMDEIEVVGSINGIYHEQSSNIQINSTETTRFRTEKIPMILCLYSDVKKLNLKVDDFIAINDEKMTLSGVVNIQEWNIIADISLEVVDYGNGS